MAENNSELTHRAEYVRLIDVVGAYLDACEEDEKRRCGLEMCRAYEAARDSILHANPGLDNYDTVGRSLGRRSV